jgi:outer membrane lipoprotein-sorting protein
LGIESEKLKYTFNIDLRGGKKEMVEKSKKWAIVVVGLLLIGVIVSAGCIGDKTTEEGEEAPIGEGTTPTTQTPTATSGDEGTSLSDLFGKAESIASVRYDMVITSPGNPSVTSKQWVKGNNMRTEITAEGQKMITIMNGDKQEMYMYFPEQNMAMKMDFSEAPESAVEEAVSIEDYNPTVIGTETIDGKLCTVVEYAVPEGSAKMWLWQKQGFPVRMEMTAPEGTSRIDWKNIEFDDISDDKFELPAGVEIMDLADMSGMPPLPSGA